MTVYLYTRGRSDASTQEHGILGCELGLYLIHPNYQSVKPKHIWEAEDNEPPRLGESRRWMVL